MDDRRKSIESYIKNLKATGNSDIGATWGDDVGFNQRLLQARNLSEEALAHEVMKNTGVPIPDKGASILRKEDFLNRILEERYPELDTELNITDAAGKGNYGAYDPNKGLIEINPKIAQTDLRKSLGTALHEAGHQYDDKILKFNSPKELLTGKNADSQLNLDKAFTKFLDSEKLPDPSKLYEVAAKGHHANIPNLREGSYGLGALKSMLKSGTFKQLAGGIPVIGGAAAAMMSGDASAAVPVLGDADNVGESKEEEFQMLAEDKARKDYNNSQARKDALKKLGR